MPHSSFNVVQFALVVVLGTVCISLVVACGGNTADQQAQSLAQLRNTHQAMIRFSETNKSHFPGLNAAGQHEKVTVQERFGILFDGDYVLAEMLISPLENDSDIEPAALDGTITENNYSYAMLQLPESGARLAEWKASINSQAPVMSDRNLGTPEAPKSLYGGDGWSGGVVWNDNRSAFEASDTVEAKYGWMELATDKLFQSEGNDDALMIHTGN